MPKKTFEQSLTELEKLVAQLEQGELSLDQSLKLYEKGVGLTRFCNDELQKAQLKIEELKAGKPDENV
jgi:exodeoxyribonuclease VII small subunit